MEKKYKVLVKATNERGEISDVSHDPGELKIMVLTDKGGVEIHSIKELKLIEEVK